MGFPPRNRADTTRLLLIALFVAVASFTRPCPVPADHAIALNAPPRFDRDRCDYHVADHSETVGAAGNPLSVGPGVSTPDVDSRDDEPGSRPSVIPWDDAADRSAP